MKQYTYYNIFETSIGNITISCENAGITGVHFGACYIPDAKNETHILLEQAKRELLEYFEKTRVSFDLPIKIKGTEFQMKVWNALALIPYGETRTYSQIAEMIHHSKACRAVGMANNKNPVPILIPCHRVIGSNGSLTGYAGGLEIKSKLLDIESSV